MSDAKQSMSPRSPDDAPPMSAATRVVGLGRPAVAPGAPLNEPITLTSTFHAGGTLAYGREGNPTWEALERTVADLEGGAGAVSFGSGLAGINAVLDLVPAGGVVVAPNHGYSGTLARLRELAADGRVNVREYRAGLDADPSPQLHGADLLWIETPSNPMLEVSDVQALSRMAAASGTRVAVDSTFATPICSQPLSLGADVVVHSATKFLAGHSDVQMGVVVAKDDQVVTLLRERRALLGSVPGPFEAWLALRGIRTLAIRMDRSISNAAELARRLNAHPDVIEVLYPGLPSHPGHDIAMRDSGPGAVVAIVMEDAERAEVVCESTSVWTHSTSLGGVESLIERRARWPFEHPDVPRGLIRLSVGIEDVEDLWADLDAALRGAAPH